MKSYRWQAGEGVAGLKLEQGPSLVTGFRDVKVRVVVAALNFRDLMVAAGAYPGVTAKPIPLADGAGVVTEVGEYVTRVKVGDRVARIYYDNWLDGPQNATSTSATPGATVDGMLAEEVVVREDCLVLIPHNLSFSQAATLGCAGVTAWNALFGEGRLHAGATVLLLGTGGVSILGLQLAKAAGWRTIITSSNDEKLLRAKSLGADHVVNYRAHPEWHTSVLEVTEGRGADIVLEVAGGPSVNKSIAAVAIAGTVAIIGGVSAFTSEVELGALIIGGRRLRGVTVGSRAMFEELNRFLVLKNVHPVEPELFPFEQAGDAFKHLQSTSHFGKVAIKVSDP